MWLVVGLWFVGWSLAALVGRHRFYEWQTRSTWMPHTLKRRTLDPEGSHYRTHYGLLMALSSLFLLLGLVMVAVGLTGLT